MLDYFNSWLPFGRSTPIDKALDMVRIQRDQERGDIIKTRLWAAQLPEAGWAQIQVQKVPVCSIIHQSYWTTIWGPFDYVISEPELWQGPSGTASHCHPPQKKGGEKDYRLHQSRINPSIGQVVRYSVQEWSVWRQAPLKASENSGYLTFDQYPPWSFPLPLIWFVYI